MATRSLNKVMLIGNLTRDPELRYTPQGTAVCTFGLATNRTWTPSDGSEKQEETEFHRIVAWAKLAEICSQILYKGRKVFVEGRLQTRKWQSQDGQDRETTEVVIDQMIALGAPKEGTYDEAEREDYAVEAPEDVSSEGEVVADAGSDFGAQATATDTDDEGTSKKKAKSTSKPATKSSQSSTGQKKTSAKKEEKKEKEEVDVDDIPF